MESKPFTDCPENCDYFPDCSKKESCTERIKEDEESIYNQALKEFAKAVSEDPSILDKIRKQDALGEFKAKYHVDKSSTLKCPTCNQFNMSGGSLWMDLEDPTRFVCRKCHITYFIKTEPISIPEIIHRLKKINKEGGIISNILEEEP